jgi:hypothetical protein
MIIIYSLESSSYLANELICPDSTALIPSLPGIVAFVSGNQKATIVD